MYDVKIFASYNFVPKKEDCVQHKWIHIEREKERKEKERKGKRKTEKGKEVKRRKWGGKRKIGKEIIAQIFVAHHLRDKSVRVGHTLLHIQKLYY